MNTTILHKIKYWIHKRTHCIAERMHCIHDRNLDMKVCGCDLTKYVPSLYRESHGATGSQSTHYQILEIIFKDLEFKDTDSLIDIGCGKGRVLSFLISKKFPGQLSGVELNESVASIPKSWAQRYQNVELISGDAFSLDLSKYNFFFLGRPFETPIFLKFLEKLEKEITKPITFIYWVDQINSHFLFERPGWIQKKRSIIKSIKLNKHLPISLPIISPQGYSIWVYNPVERINYQGPLYKELYECSDYSQINDRKINRDYLNKYDVVFDRTITGKYFVYPRKWDKNFKESSCFMSNDT